MESAAAAYISDHKESVTVYHFRVIKDEPK